MPSFPYPPPSFPQKRPNPTPLPLGEGGRRPGEGPQSPCYTRPLPLGPAYLPRGVPSPQPSPRGRGGRRLGSLPWAPVPNPTPLPLGEGGRRPGEGPQSPCYTRPLPLGPAYLPRGVPSPQPSPRGRGGRRLGSLPWAPVPNPTPLPLGEGGRRPGEGPQSPCYTRPLPLGPAYLPRGVPSPQPSPRGRGGRRLGSLPWAPVPNPTPLPLGEGGRRPGEGPQSPCYTRPLPLGPAYLPRGPLTPSLSQRERGSEAGQLAMGTRPNPTPLPLGEGGRRPGEGPQSPCYTRPLPLGPAYLPRGVPSPQPSPRGRGGRRLGSLPWAPVPNPTPLPLGEGGRRPGEGPQSPCYTRPLPLGPAYLPRGPLTPALSQRERGSEGTLHHAPASSVRFPRGSPLRLPGVVAAEVPEIAFRVAAAIEPAAVVLVFGGHDDLGARGNRSGVVRVHVRDHDVDA